MGCFVVVGCGGGEEGVDVGDSVMIGLGSFGDTGALFIPNQLL